MPKFPFNVIGVTVTWPAVKSPLMLKSLKALSPTTIVCPLVRFARLTPVPLVITCASETVAKDTARAVDTQIAQKRSLLIIVMFSLVPILTSKWIGMKNSSLTSLL